MPADRETPPSPVPHSPARGGCASQARVSEPEKALRIVLLDFRDIRHPEAGGAEEYMHEIFRRLVAWGHRVTFITAAGYRGAVREETIDGIRFLRVANQPTINFLAPRAALKLARREPVDVFVEDICKIPFLMPALTRTPVLPVVLHLFGDTIFKELNPLVATYVWAFEHLIPPLYRNIPFVALSDSTARDLERRGVRATRMDVIPPGLNLERYPFRHAAERPGPPLLLYLGRLKRYKEIDIPLRAFAKIRRDIPDAQLALVGKGDDAARLEALARSLGVGEAVSFPGFVSEAEKVEWLRRAWLLLYPSPKEGWGISTMEASACGLPVLASDSPGLRDAVRDGTSGYLVPHHDVEAWAARMRELLTDPAHRARLSEQGRAWAERFDWDNEARKMLAALRGLVTGDG